MANELTTFEAALLAECETAIERGLATFVEVGQALLRIRDERLYRSSHKTFEEYCRERWGWSKTHANRQIEAAGVAQNLTPIGVKPENEAQARVLAPLPPDMQREVWGKAAANGKVTARELEGLIRDIAKERGVHLREEEPAEARTGDSEERRDDEDLERQMKANSEHNAKFYVFTNAIEGLSNPPLPLDEVAERICKLKWPKVDWRGLAPLAAKNFRRLVEEIAKYDHATDVHPGRSNSGSPGRVARRIRPRHR
jgi:hypothetical protein